MAIVQISRIQIRRGLNQDLPQLASAEMGWSLDTQQLYIGNGTIEEGSPRIGVTEILTTNSDVLSLSRGYTFKNLSSGTQVVTGVNSASPIVRSLQDKLDDYCSVKDFGAVGDGVTDDTAAIQRALTRTYGGSQGQAPVFHHRTVNFPAGDYRITSTLNIPPYTRIQGEGKRTTIIEGSFTGPLARVVDGNGDYDSDYGLTGADTAEYHINDICFARTGPTYDQSCFVMDGATSATFNRVMFRGALTNVTSDYGSINPAYASFDITRADGVYGGYPAGLKLINNSYYQAVKNVVINQCDFYQITVGVEFNQDCHGITINDCYFDYNYHYIVAGNLSPDPANYSPYGISVANNYFRYCATEGIYCYPFVSQVMSLCNSYLGYGQLDWPGENPITNPYNESKYPALVFNADNNFSIGDSFSPDTFGAATATTSGTNTITVAGTSRMYPGIAIKFLGGTPFGGLQPDRQYIVRTVLDNHNITVSNTASTANVTLSSATGTLQYVLGGVASGVKYIEDNGYQSYQVIQDIGIVDGRRTDGRARTTTLANSSSFTSAGLSYIPSNYTNLTLQYTLTHTGAQRVGEMKVTRVGSTFIWTEEFSETGSTGVYLQANTTTGDIEYTSVSSGAPTSITYNLNYFS